MSPWVLWSTWSNVQKYSETNNIIQLSAVIGKYAL